MQTGTKPWPGAARRGGRGRVRAAAVLAAALLALAAAGCAGNGGKRGGVASLGQAGNAKQSDSGNKASQGKDAQQGALDFARCMREHGIDMPDPKLDANGLMRIQVGGRRADPKKLQAAQQACQQHLQNGGEGPRKLDPKMQDQALKFARCMREHGVDMPDPKPDGGLVLQAGPGPESPKFKEAQQACQSLMPALDAQREDSGGKP